MGLRDGISIGVGYLAVSFAFGISATSMGLTVWQTVLISLFNLTSAGQVAAVPIIASSGSLFELASTQLVINSRYTLMGVSLSQRLGTSVRTRDRFWVGFANADELFAVITCQRSPVGKAYLLGLILPPVIGWNLGTAIGALAGDLLPPIIVTSLSVSIYAMFIAIILPAARRSLGTLLCILTAAALSCLFYYIPTLSAVPSGFVIVIIAIVVSALFAILFPVSDTEGEEARV